MARPGFIEARNAYYKAQEDLSKNEASLERMNTNPPDHLKGYVLEQEIKIFGKMVDQSKIDLEASKKAFDVFNAVEAKPERKYFSAALTVHLSLDSDTITKIDSARKIGNISMAEIIRRALTVYFDAVQAE